jgi:hypothetical protein
MAVRISRSERRSSISRSRWRGDAGQRHDRRGEDGHERRDHEQLDEREAGLEASGESTITSL